MLRFSRGLGASLPFIGVFGYFQYQRSKLDASPPLLGRAEVATRSFLKEQGVPNWDTVSIRLCENNEAPAFLFGKIFLPKLEVQEFGEVLKNLELPAAERDPAVDVYSGFAGPFVTYCLTRELHRLQHSQGQINALYTMSAPILVTLGATILTGTVRDIFKIAPVPQTPAGVALRSALAIAGGIGRTVISAAIASRQVQRGESLIDFETQQLVDDQILVATNYAFIKQYSQQRFFLENSEHSPLRLRAFAAVARVLRGSSTTEGSLMQFVEANPWLRNTHAFLVDPTHPPLAGRIANVYFRIGFNEKGKRTPQDLQRLKDQMYESWQASLTPQSRAVKSS